ncbi:DUF397 domain-containing protein [Streptomyces sp. JW3]|uniref:DUF397 domain-containing protein n=1 Tax=Streptomyces sp. JW3 TaxID=3456955 RepID=UPI003FA44406
MNTEKPIADVGALLRWFKSSYSSEEGGECVEVAIGAHVVHIRDSKHLMQDGPVLTTSSVAWLALLDVM